MRDIQPSKITLPGLAGSKARPTAVGIRLPSKVTLANESCYSTKLRWGVKRDQLQSLLDCRVNLPLQASMFTPLNFVEEKNEKYSYKRVTLPL